MAMLVLISSVQPVFGLQRHACAVSQGEMTCCGSSAGVDPTAIAETPEPTSGCCSSEEVEDASTAPRPIESVTPGDSDAPSCLCRTVPSGEPTPSSAMARAGPSGDDGALVELIARRARHPAVRAPIATTPQAATGDRGGGSRASGVGPHGTGVARRAGARDVHLLVLRGIRAHLAQLAIDRS